MDWALYWSKSIGNGSSVESHLEPHKLLERPNQQALGSLESLQHLFRNDGANLGFRRGWDEKDL